MQLYGDLQKFLDEVDIEYEADEDNKDADYTYDPSTCNVVTSGRFDILHVLLHRLPVPLWCCSIIIECRNISWFSRM